jgi:hypothetical protein
MTGDNQNEREGESVVSLSMMTTAEDGIVPGRR